MSSVEQHLTLNQTNIHHHQKSVKFRNPKLPLEFFYNSITLTKQKIGQSDLFQQSTQQNSPTTTVSTARRVARSRKLSITKLGRYANTAQQKHLLQNPKNLLQQIIQVNKKWKKTIFRHSVELQHERLSRKHGQHIFFPPLLKKDRKSFS